MKLLSIQPSSIYENGGSGRVLRRLFHGKEKKITAIYVSPSISKPKEGLITEIRINWHPLHRKWVRWKFRNIFSYLRMTLGKRLVEKRLLAIIKDLEFDVIHIINHGKFCAFLSKSRGDLLHNKSIWVSFHDHYSLCSTFEDTKFLWNSAKKRFCISQELGNEYQRLFGSLPFEVITDGIYMMERSQPLRHIDDKQFVVYFAGLLHIDYYPNFKALAKALNMIAEEGVSIKLILRGTQKLNFLNDVKFRVVYNSDFVSDEEIKKEIDAATILYLPMKFTVPEFYLYSMSTKMISYLTAKGSIFYHGPENSAAANLLHKWDAATICESLNVTEVKDDLLLCLRDINQHSSNAKELARDQFNMNEILDKFWN